MSRSGTFHGRQFLGVFIHFTGIHVVSHEDDVRNVDGGWDFEEIRSLHREVGQWSKGVPADGILACRRDEPRSSRKVNHFGFIAGARNR